MNAILKTDKERLIQRELFKKKYKLFSALQNEDNRKVFAMFKNSFYEIQDSSELFMLKNLRQYRDESAYLDYISCEELVYLNKGLDDIIYYIFNSNDKDFSVRNKLEELGVRARYDFLEEYGVYPENVESFKNVNKVKKCLEQSQLSNKKYKQNQFDFKNSKNEDEKIM